jgi:BirA family biotin operon repressor/biotin-[acetyl-CoA-carboxylase] ligase
MDSEQGPGSLEAALVRERLSPTARRGLAGLTVLGRTDSTQEALLRLPAEQRHAHAVLADRQTRGRGRRGRSWHSPAGSNVYLSLGWRFGRPPEALLGLPLVVALAAARAVRGLGLRDVRIKWPNDLVLAADEGRAPSRTPFRKLGGCLVELRDPRGSACLALIGIGLNVAMDPAAAGVIDQPWTALAAYLPDVDREQCAAALLGELILSVELFEREGFEPFRADWPAFDALAGRQVRLQGEAGDLEGTALGIGPRGGLLLQTGDGTSEQLAGDLSLDRSSAP